MNCRSFVAATLAGASALAASAASPRSELTLKEVIARHTKARGGAAAMDAVESQAVDLQTIEDGTVIKAHYVCNKTPAFRIDIFVGGKHVFCEGLDATGPWIWPSSEPAAKEGVPDARRTGVEGVEFNLYGLHSFPALGNVLSLDGRKRLGGVDFYVVQVDLKGSYRTFLYIDPETWMIARRRDFRAAHPDVDDTKKYLEKQYTDYRPVNGVQTAFLEHQIDLASGKITQVTIVDQMSYNPKLDENAFNRSYNPG